MKLGAVVILYNPDEELKYNINSYLSKVELLLVLDNSGTDKAKALFEGIPKIQYYWDGENRGISYRLNQALKICREKNIIYLLTMDQDSSFDPTMLDKYLHQIEKCPVLENVGMFGINLDKNDKNDYYDELFITSGSIINVDLAQQIGDFDEKLFIDEVDNEFCLRLILNKYSTLKFGNITMNHQFGSTRKVLTPCLRYKERVIYSPLRNYYNTRNYFYINKIYKHDYKQKKDRKTMLLYRIKNSLLYENTFATIYYILKGFKDYVFMNMGKIQQ